MQQELLEWLPGRAVTTVYALRRERFTVRTIAAAEQDGRGVVDLGTGSVALS